MNIIEFNDLSIDNLPLDAQLDAYFKNEGIMHLEFSLDIIKDNLTTREIIIQNILPEKNMISICPILVQDDDWNLEEDYIVVRILNDGKNIYWTSFGKMDHLFKSNELETENILWFKENLEFKFDIDLYKAKLLAYLKIKRST